MAYKTPGVYVEELTTLAPSVVAVETAIPAFIGYTEKAVDAIGGTLGFVPTRITSLLEYQGLFGGDFVPTTYQVVVNVAAGNAIGAVSPRNAGNTERRYRLFNAVRHYYANGGGPCYIVSVGSYADAPALGTVAPPAGLAGGLSRVEPVDDPTLLVFPDGVSLTAADMGSLQVAALAQCEKLQDRFVIMDVCQGDQPISSALDPIADFRQNVGTLSLKYGAAYYPWLRTIYAPDTHFRQLRLVDPASAPLATAVIDSLTTDTDLNALVPAVRAADATVGVIVSAVDVSGTTPTLTLSRATFGRLPDHYAALVEQLRQLPVAASDAEVRQRFTNLLLLPRALALSLRMFDTQSVSGISRSGGTATVTTAGAHGYSSGQPVTIAGANQSPYNGTFTIQVTAPTTFTYTVTGSPATPATGTITALAALPATLAAAVSELRRDTQLRSRISELVAYEKNASVMDAVANGRTVANVATDYARLNGSDWILPNANVGAVGPSPDDFTTSPANLRGTALNASTALRRLFDPLASAVLSLFSAAEFLASEAEKQLFARHPVFGNVASEVTRTMVLQPPSGAVAGVYAAVDRTRGVWKAPANVSLADVSGVAVKINDQIQEDLNVTSTGKSVNVVRAFTGKGSLIWGARTLAGNDNEWRYVPVRRFFNMAEESIKKASEPFVFEPNDRGTWVRVRAMIENFLTVQWRQGALAGAVTQQAYFVKVGLGETMTAQDILEGRMIVEVGLAVVRPAEFIVLRFAHKMQTS